MNKQPAQVLLAKLRGGEILNRLTDELYTAAVVAHDMRKPATVTLSITIRPEGTAGVSDLLAVAADVTTKLPRRDPQESPFFFNEDEGLSDTMRKSREPELPGIAIATLPTGTNGA